MRIYISGPVTGTEGHEEHFAEAEEYLRKLGQKPINPVKAMLNIPELNSWEEYMKLAICLLEMCDAIFMLQGWKDSRGASIEFEFAYKNEMSIFFEKENMYEQAEKSE